MKDFIVLSMVAIMMCALYACDNETDLPDLSPKELLPRFQNVVKIDSAYTYTGDSLYGSWVDEYNRYGMATTRLSAADEAFFCKEYVVKSTEPVVMYGKNYIYPGSILEGNSISDQNYVPVILSSRNPITVSSTLAHNTPVHTSKTIENPTLSKINDYIVDMVQDGNFEQNQGFMFDYSRFTFYDEIKSVFGCNIDTKKLFSSKSESTTEERVKIQKSTGLYAKFFQSSFTINMDIASLCNGTVKGKSGYEPVYVNSVTYGRMGIFVLETDTTYAFAESCIKKEFDRIFYNKNTVLTTKERQFFENTEFKVLIIGADSNYAVQTFKGYSYFLNLIYNSKFTPQSYGVPIKCSFAYANSHELVETEFRNVVQVEPLFVQVKMLNSQYAEDSRVVGDYTSSSSSHMYFWKDREKTKTAIPYTDIIFTVQKSVEDILYKPDYNRWPMIYMTPSTEVSYTQKRNIDFETSMFMGHNSGYRISTGPTPISGEPIRQWQSVEHSVRHTLCSSPFFLIIQ